MVLNRGGLCVALAMLAAISWTASAGATFPGPNGQIAYDYNGNSGIHRVNADGSLDVDVASPPDARRAAWSPDDRTIAYSAEVGGNRDIYTVRYDGTDARRLTTDLASDDEPAWSPDGGRVVFARSNSNLYVVNATGTLESPLHGGLPGRLPNWSPDGQRIVYVTPANRIAVVDVQTAAVTQLTGLNGEGCCDSEPNWSPDGQKIAFTSSRPEGPGIYTMDADGTDPARIRTTGRGPAWSPDGTMIAFTDGGCGNIPPFRCFFTLRRMNADGSSDAFIAGNAFTPLNDPDWGSFRVEDIGYPRPQGATPLVVALVPAYDQCTEPNRTHGPPLAYPSCAPPVQSSTPGNPEASGLTVGTYDSNGKASRSVGSIALRVVPGDVRVEGRLTDVRCRVAFTACPGGPLSDYTGELEGRLTNARITDHEGAPSTIADLAPMSFALSCAATPASDAGSTCSASTTLNTLLPGVAVEGNRAIWQLGRMEVWDGGGDGEAAATDDNELFATQGIFVP